MDHFSGLFDQFAPSARAFFTGNLCNNVVFDDRETTGYLHILRSGRLQVDGDGDSSFELTDPSLLFVPSHALHSFVPDVLTGADLVCARVQIGGSQANPITHSLPPMLIIPLSSIPTIAPTLDLLLTEAFGDHDGRQLALDRLFEYLIVQLLRHVVAQGQLKGGVLAGLADARLARALKAVHEAPGSPWTLDSLAEIAGMSRTRFAAHFRKLVGMTPMDYVTRWRMSVAQNLLRKGRTIKSVSAAVGYDSAAAFSRTFAKIVEQSPRQWAARDNGVIAKHAGASLVVAS